MREPGPAVTPPDPALIMTLDDCLDAGSIQIGFDALALEDVLNVLLDVPELTHGDPRRRAKWSRDLGFGSQGEVVRLHDDVVLVLDVDEAVDEPRAALAVTHEAFTVTGEGSEEPGTAQAVLLFLLPGRLSAFRGQAAPALGRWVREADHAARLLGAASAADVQALPGLGRIVLSDRLRVDGVSSPVPHRVRADTSVGDVLDLMVRQSVHAVPVVGDADELLGIITVGDALRHLLPRRRLDGESGPALEVEGRTARDIMTRSVLCVAEDQALTDAAAMMVNRDIDELPVVREGALVGLLTKDSVLRALHDS